MKDIKELDGKVVYAVATGRIRLYMKASREAAMFITGLEGFLAVFPFDKGTLWLFDSKNNAKMARNMMATRGIRFGKHISKGHFEGNSLIMD